MTPHESLLSLIKSQVPRLRDWEMEGLATRISDDLGLTFLMFPWATLTCSIHQIPDPDCHICRKEKAEPVEACIHGCTHIYPDVCFDPECPMGSRGVV